MEEKWKKIKGYENYQVSNLGKVKGKNILKGWNLNGRKYVQIGLSKNGAIKKFLVHRLVAKAFLKNPLNKEQVNHIDNNPSNNIVSNLEWVTAKENTHYTIKQGRNMRGEKTNSCKIKEEDVKEIRKSKLTVTELMKIYKLSRMQIHRIIKKQRWTHII